MCTAWNVVSHCGVETTCPGGCYAGACRPDACADECALGATGPDGTCRLWDVGTASWVMPMPTANLIDRARDYDRLARESNLPEGGVATAIYASPALNAIVGYDGIVDSALWTGTLLAAQGWRLRVTGAPDAAARVVAMARTLHVWFNLSQSPGYLARYAVPEGSPVLVEMDCSRRVIHCGAMFEGTEYRWRGDTSRDQYTGVMLGYTAAYQATTDAATREAIRADVVKLVEELMRDRHDIPVRATINGLPIETTLDTRFVVLAPEEMTDGRVTMDIDTDDIGDGQLDGAREFVPDIGPIIAQLIGFSPEIPRPGSAMMLGAFYRLALLVTDGVPAYAERRAAIRADYDASFELLVRIAAQVEHENACGSKYYGNHIDVIMAYAWAMLEDDPGRRARIRDEVVGGLWTKLADHKNVYFAFMAAGAGATPNADSALEQLRQFQAGPRILAPRDHTGDYPHDPDCTDGGHPFSAVAVDVGDRVVADFMWQRHPWRLFDVGAPERVAPGADFMAAYWLGRLHDIVPDDRPGTCARWDD